MLPMVVIPIRQVRKLRNRDVASIVSNRVNSNKEEQYLVKWSSSKPTSYPVFSWHTSQELVNCLELLQDHLEAKQTHSSRKRKSPDSDVEVERRASPSTRLLPSSRASSTSSTERSSVSSGRTINPEIKVYNGVLEESEGAIKAKSVTRPDIPRISVANMPTPEMVQTARSSSTYTAENMIRNEILQRLRALPGAKIHLSNVHDRSAPSLRFKFISESVLQEGVFKADPATQIGCQQCRPHMGRHIGCEYTKKCDCLEYASVDESRLSDEQKKEYRIIREQGGSTIGLPKKFPYYADATNRTGCLVPFYLKSRNPIYECNDSCACGAFCRNKNVQRGRHVELEIFKTKKRGWGLRAKQDLREGEFIDTYRGEIITDEEATRREESGGKAKASYLYSLDKFAESEGLSQEELYVIDGEYMGGPIKFMNHSCEPNCRQYTVSYNKHDCKVYDIAIFACRDIPAMEELTFDYLDKDEEEENEEDAESSQPSQESVPCLCGAKKCRKWLWT
ncbi:SET domain-containing protein [Mytilinidion resinicola]|uniref:SET domain-containing protein n=1 Tax=Mytilinidion resinicola TaxID=574789 RepID=A0A6A6Y7L3_9PEZI|nr:SET domain-containing protein [Mytilinidion resinicola]KAF2804831.1 SET domain-containing protein [Mytilinidion resinicola]